MPIDERAFINKKRVNWERLSLIVERTKTGGLGQLSKQELPQLGSLYRRAAADLAYARQQGANPNLVLYLNELVGNAHGVIYQEDAGGWPRIWRFLKYGLPAVLRKRMPFILAAFLLMVIGGVMAYSMVRHNDQYASLFLSPDMQSSVEMWKAGAANHMDVSAGEGIMGAAWYMTHNTQVGIMAFATGITEVVPVCLIFYTGAQFGALAAVVQPTGYTATLWAGVLPHGVWELSAIFICAGAGMLIGWAVIAPGKHSRKDALIIAGRDACKMMVGTVPLFILAGILEQNFSRTSFPQPAKFAFAAFEFCVFLFYIFGSREKSNIASKPKSDF